MKARLAYADMPVPRLSLTQSSARLAIREVLYRKLATLGMVDPNAIRFVRDPHDGPLSEQGLPDDETAIVRISARVAETD